VYQLVIQFEASDLRGFDELVLLESSLGVLPGLQAEVDGHDAGAGEMNLFLISENPEIAFSQCLSEVQASPLRLRGAGFRALDADTYTRLWPAGSREVFRVA
jgi:hypothetical protein